MGTMAWTRSSWFHPHFLHPHCLWFGRGLGLVRSPERLVPRKPAGSDRDKTAATRRFASLAYVGPHAKRRGWGQAEPRLEEDGVGCFPVDGGGQPSSYAVWLSNGVSTMRIPLCTIAGADLPCRRRYRGAVSHLGPNPIGTVGSPYASLCKSNLRFR